MRPSFDHSHVLSEQKYSNLTMLEPLMNQMVHQDPARRPTAAEAHRQFRAIRRDVPSLYQYWSLQPRDSSLVVRVFQHTYSLVSTHILHCRATPNRFHAVLRHISHDLRKFASCNA